MVRINFTLYRPILFCLVFLPGLAFDMNGQDQENDTDRSLFDSIEHIRTNYLTNLVNDKIRPSTKSEPSLPKVNIGGAIRLNYAWRDYDDQNMDRVGDFGFEMFRVDAEIDYKDIFMAVEFRWYEHFNAIRFGYFGYHITDRTSIQVGIHQVPFGMKPYSSHSFWFNATYYLGFEDDYDAGIKLIYDNKYWNIQGAFYKNPEYQDSERYGRYSFDLVTDEVQTNQEINQFNLRTIYKWRIKGEFLMKLGASAEAGQIYNKTTRKNGDRYAFALHNNMFYRNWNWQLQWITYGYEPENPEGISDKTVQYGAFTFPFLATAKADIYTLNIANQINLDGKYLDKIKLYVNTSVVQPKNNYGKVSKQVVLGTTLIKRGLYTYIDYIFGQNMWFSGGPGIGLDHPDHSQWNSRLNINFGFYF